MRHNLHAAGARTVTHCIPFRSCRAGAYVTWVWIISRVVSPEPSIIDGSDWRIWVSRKRRKTRPIFQNKNAEWLRCTKMVRISLYCFKCTKLGQLILSRIIKTVATRCQILRLRCTKIDFGWSPKPRWGSLQRSPRPPSWI